MSSLSAAAFAAVRRALDGDVDDAAAAEHASEDDGDVKRDVDGQVVLTHEGAEDTSEAEEPPPAYVTAATPVVHGSVVHV